MRQPHKLNSTESCPRRQRRSPLCRSGYTMLEMVAATVLLSILFAAVTGVLRGFYAQQRASRTLADQHPDVSQLAMLLRRDLTNADSFQFTNKQLQLFGNLAQDPATRLPTGRLALVTYRLDTLAGTPWLIRHETDLARRSSNQARQEPVWQGVSEFEFAATVDSSSASDTQLISLGSSGAELTMRPMPAQLRLRLGTKQNRLIQDRPLLVLNVLHHWEGY